MEHAASSPAELGFLREVVVFLIAAVVVVPIFERLKASPILGYLVVGALIGPFGLAVVDDVAGVHQLAELGVVFLLFTIGLKLSPARLWAMRGFVFVLGTAQVAVTGAAIALIAWAWGNPGQSALVLGACLALSSTALVMQLLTERGEIASLYGRASFGVLLFQDLAVVPLLVLVTVLGEAGAASVWQALGIALLRALGAIAVIYIVARLLARPLFARVAGRSSPELFMAMILLAVLGTAWATATAGLSMALGAFLAGLLIAETEFQYQVEADIQPFKSLLLGLFFISIGMSLDLTTVVDRAFWVVASVLGLIALKAVLMIGIGRLYGLRWEAALRSGLMLGQAGEFAFVIVGAALAEGLLRTPVAQFMMAVAGLSMAVTPLLAPQGGRVVAWVGARSAGAAETIADASDWADHVIIAGGGRVGQTVAELLQQAEVPCVAVDLDVRRLGQCRARGIPAIYGDATHRSIVAKLGVERALAAVVTLNNTDDALQVMRNLQSAASAELPIYVRSHEKDDVARLRSLGGHRVVPETLESSLQLGGHLLCELGTPQDTVNHLIDQVRHRAYAGKAAAG